MALEDDKLRATDNKALADKNGLTYWNEARGQWTAPPVEREVAHKAAATPVKAVEPVEPVKPVKPVTEK